MISWLKLMFSVLRGHRWSYHNPYDRTCTVCARHEVEHCWAGHPNQSWWEVFDEGNPEAHRH